MEFEVFCLSAILMYLSAVQCLRYTTQLFSSSLPWLLSLFLHPSSFFCSAGVPLLCEVRSTFLQSCSLIVFCAPLGRMPRVTRWIRASSSQVFFGRHLQRSARDTNSSGSTALRRASSTFLVGDKGAPWPTKWFSKTSFTWSFSLRSEVLNVSQVTVMFNGIGPPFLHQKHRDCCPLCNYILFRIGEALM